MTTALIPGRQRSNNARVSSRLRKTKTPSFFTSSMEGISGYASSRQQEFVERSHASVIAGHGLGLGIDTSDADAEPKVDAVLLVPIEAVQDDVVAGFFSRQNRRKQNAVVVDVSLVAKDRDFKLWRVAQDLLHAGHAGHSVSYDYQLFHEVTSTEIAFCRRVSLPRRSL